MRFTLRGSIFALFVTAISGAHAQPASQCDTITLVDISLRENTEQQLELYLRSQQDFGGYFAAMSFTIRWLDEDDAVLGNLVPQVPYFSLGTSGPTHVDGIHRYQIYAGFSVGFNTLEEWEMPWLANEEVLLAKINITDLPSGNSIFEIANDDFTAANNGDYYISLGGYNCFGDVYTINVGLADLEADWDASVVPNPTSGQVRLVADLRSATLVHMELTDAAGRTAGQWSKAGNQGLFEQWIDLTGLRQGVYTLKVQASDQTSVHRIVLTGQ